MRDEQFSRENSAKSSTGKETIWLLRLRRLGLWSSTTGVERSGLLLSCKLLGQLDLLGRLTRGDAAPITGGCRREEAPTTTAAATTEEWSSSGRRRDARGSGNRGGGRAWVRAEGGSSHHCRQLGIVQKRRYCTRVGCVQYLCLKT